MFVLILLAVLRQFIFDFPSLSIQTKKEQTPHPLLIPFTKSSPQKKKHLVCVAITGIYHSYIYIFLCYIFLQIAIELSLIQMQLQHYRPIYDYYSPRLRFDSTLFTLQNGATMPSDFRFRLPASCFLLPASTILYPFSLSDSCSTFNCHN